MSLISPQLQDQRLSNVEPPAASPATQLPASPLKLNQEEDGVFSVMGHAPWQPLCQGPGGPWDVQSSSTTALVAAGASLEFLW